MSRAKLPRNRRTLLLGAIGLLLLLAGWLDSIWDETLLRVCGPSLSHEWGFSLRTRDGQFELAGGISEKNPASLGPADSEFRRRILPHWEYGFNSCPRFDFDNTPVNFFLLLPHWFLVLLYLAVWLGILGGPRLYRRLKERHPPA